MLCIAQGKTGFCPNQGEVKSSVYQNTNVAQEMSTLQLSADQESRPTQTPPEHKLSPAPPFLRANIYSFQNYFFEHVLFKIKIQFYLIWCLSWQRLDGREKKKRQDEHFVGFRVLTPALGSSVANLELQLSKLGRLFISSCSKNWPIIPLGVHVVQLVRANSWWSIWNEIKISSAPICA